MLSYTTGYARLVGPVGLLDAQRPNLARFVFTDPRARAAYPEWDRIADEQAAILRMGSCPQVAELVEELTITAGAAFTDRLRASPTFPKRTGVALLAHPDAGDLRLAYETLELPDTDDQHLVIYLPADHATSAALDRLTGRQPGALRAVTG